MPAMTLRSDADSGFVVTKVAIALTSTVRATFLSIDGQTRSQLLNCRPTTNRLRPDHSAINAGDRRPSRERHRHREFFTQNVYDFCYASFPFSTQSPHIRSADKHCVCTQRQGLKHIRASADSSVHKNRHPTGNFLRNQWQGSIVAGIVSRLRAPWFETIIPDIPALIASSASSGLRIPLARIGSWVNERIHSIVFHVSVGSKIGV